MSREPLTTQSRAAVAVWPEMGQMLGVGRHLAYHLVNSGQIRSVRVGARILVPVKAIDAFLDAGLQAQDAA